MAIKRLEECNLATDPSIWDFFPWSEDALDDNKKEALKIYIYGYGIAIGRLDVSGLNIIYDYMNEDLDKLMEEVKVHIYSAN